MIINKYENRIIREMSTNDSFYSKSILVVDDDPDFLPTLVDMINEFGYDNIITAEDGEEAVSLYKKHRPDLVLMDIVMPKMDGITAFFKIKEFDPLSRIIFITAYDPPTKYMEAKAKCAIYLARKPFSNLFLNELINRHIQEKPICT